MAEIPKRGFDVFSNHDDIQVNRLGKNVMIKARDGSFSDSTSVEANLLFEILKALRKK